MNAKDSKAKNRFEAFKPLSHSMQFLSVLSDPHEKPEKHFQLQSWKMSSQFVHLNRPISNLDWPTSKVAHLECKTDTTIRTRDDVTRIIGSKR